MLVKKTWCAWAPNIYNTLFGGNNLIFFSHPNTIMFLINGHLDGIEGLMSVIDTEKEKNKETQAGGFVLRHMQGRE